MSETPREITPEPCRAVGALVVDGVRKAWLRCALPAGHDAPLVCDGDSVGIPPHKPHTAPGTPHAVTFSWADDEAMRDDWPEAYDPAEPIDVDVPMLSDDELAAIAEVEPEVEPEGVALDDLLDDLEAVTEAARVDAAVDAEREARAWPDEA